VFALAEICFKKLNDSQTKSFEPEGAGAWPLALQPSFTKEPIFFILLYESLLSEFTQETVSWECMTQCHVTLGTLSARKYTIRGDIHPFD
jgi:hypothetical protein